MKMINAGENGKNAKGSQEADEQRKGRRRFWALIIIILLLLFLFLIFQWKIAEKRAAQEREFKQQQLILAIEKAQRIADSIMREDSLKRLADSFGLRHIDSSLQSGDESPSLQRGDTVKNKNRVSATPSPKGDTPLKTPETAGGAQAAAAQKNSDSTAPSPSVLPPAGRYYNPINLRVECGEPKCSGELAADTVSAPRSPTVENYNKTGKMFFRATDSAGNVSAWQAAEYNMASDNNCASNSYPVQVNGKTICVDAYEYPNKSGEKPRNMVTKDAAARLCENEGKHLCSIEEWRAACKGNANLKYPYGNAYNQTKCATDLRSAKEPLRSGFAEHCRSWHGMYDMSGNLWEWTSTPADREGLFLVAGGAWNTQNASSCAETKFSFYPQNEYPFVGFRCCK